MNQPQPGDVVFYYGRHESLCMGLLAERAPSPLTGNPRYRVVDKWSEASDPEAGRWVGIEDVHSIDNPWTEEVIAELKHQRDTAGWDAAMQLWKEAQL